MLYLLNIFSRLIAAEGADRERERVADFIIASIHSRVSFCGQQSDRGTHILRVFYHTFYIDVLFILSN
jgi:hypothetical protein